LDAKTQTIKSANWKGRSINIEGNGSSPYLYMRGTNARWFQLWSYDSKTSTLVNEKGKVMEVNKGSEKVNTYIMAKKADGSLK